MVAGLTVAMATAGRAVSEVLLDDGAVRLTGGETDMETGAVAVAVATAAVIGQAGSILFMVTSMAKSVLLEK